jgi:hypothetical protein
MIRIAACPMPDVAPVMTTTFPFMSWFMALEIRE